MHLYSHAVHASLLTRRSYISTHTPFIHLYSHAVHTSPHLCTAKNPPKSVAPDHSANTSLFKRSGSLANNTMKHCLFFTTLSTFELHDIPWIYMYAIHCYTFTNTFVTILMCYVVYIHILFLVWVDNSERAGQPSCLCLHSTCVSCNCCKRVFLCTCNGVST